MPRFPKKTRTELNPTVFSNHQYKGMKRKQNQLGKRETHGILAVFEEDFTMLKLAPETERKSLYLALELEFRKWRVTKSIERQTDTSFTSLPSQKQLGELRKAWAIYLNAMNREHRQQLAARTWAVAIAKERSTTVSYMSPPGSSTPHSGSKVVDQAAFQHADALYPEPTRIISQLRNNTNEQAMPALVAALSETNAQQQVYYKQYKDGWDAMDDYY